MMKTLLATIAITLCVSPTVAQYTGLGITGHTPITAPAPPPPAPWDGTIWSNVPSSEPPGVTHATYHSQLMSVDIGYNIYLPPGYSSRSARYPVLYWLHGQPGDENWHPTTLVSTLQSMISAGTIAPMIIVFPNGSQDSHYMDAQPGSPAYPWFEMENTFINEFIPYIDSHYRTNATPGQRAVQGESMGGQGCERFAFKYPYLWSSAYCLMPAIDDKASDVATKEPQLLANMFNGDTTAFQNQTVWNLVTLNPSAVNGLPIHVIIGDQDSLYYATECSPMGGKCQNDMDTLMTQQGIAHDPLQVIHGCGHDGACLLGSVNFANLTYAALHFH